MNMKAKPNAGSLPMTRKAEAMSAPHLVATRRACFIQLAKAKLLNYTNSNSLEAYLTRLDAELKRRNITIQDPELRNEHCSTDPDPDVDPPEGS